jgi:hypothetical protein
LPCRAPSPVGGYARPRRKQDPSRMVSSLGPAPVLVIVIERDGRGRPSQPPSAASHLSASHAPACRGPHRSRPSGTVIRRVVRRAAPLRGFRRPFLERMGAIARSRQFSPEVRERAVRMVFEHAQDHPSQWPAITSIAEKIGCAAETPPLGAAGRARHWPAAQHDDRRADAVQAA